MAHFAQNAQFWNVFMNFSVTIILINMGIFLLSPIFQGTSFKYHKPNICWKKYFDFKGAAQIVNNSIKYNSIKYFFLLVPSLCRIKNILHKGCSVYGFHQKLIGNTKRVYQKLCWSGLTTKSVSHLSWQIKHPLDRTDL